jgi:hypothetical protein
MAKKQPTDALLKELREFGLTYPGAHTKSPWPGHLDLAVNDKTFAYLSVEGDPLKVSCKLPASAELALMMPFCKPTAYGLGKSGWVSAEFAPGQPLPELVMLKAWVDESYRAQAPKKLVAQLDAGGSASGNVRATKPATRGTSKSAAGTVAKKRSTKTAAAKSNTGKAPARAASSNAKPAQRALKSKSAKSASRASKS